MRFRDGMPHINDREQNDLLYIHSSSFANLS